MSPTLPRLAFWAALAGTLYLALAPETLIPMTYDKVAIAVTSVTPSAINSDKSQHEAAFFVLMIFGALGYPALALRTIALGLLALGGMIELLQALPIFARDCELMDWAADVAAIAVGMIVIVALRSMLPRLPGIALQTA